MFPGKPCGPCAPGGPCAPVSPCAPGLLVGLVSPEDLGLLYLLGLPGLLVGLVTLVGPAVPLGLLDELILVDPLGLHRPVDPRSLVLPVSLVGRLTSVPPCGPAGPSGPIKPWGPWTP